MNKNEGKGEMEVEITQTSYHDPMNYSGLWLYPLVPLDRLLLLGESQICI